MVALAKFPDVTTNDEPITLRDVITLTAADKPTLENVRVGDIQIGDYQRQLNQAHVDRIAAEFNWQLFFAVGLSHRSDGSYFCFEGQHRVAAVRKLHGDNEEVPAICITGLTPEDEAYLFYAMQTTRRNLHPYDRFNAQLQRGEPRAVQMDQIVRSHGYELKNYTGLHTIAAVSAVERLFYPAARVTNTSSTSSPRVQGGGVKWSGPERLDWVLKQVVSAWEYRYPIGADMLKAVGLFFGVKAEGKPPLDDYRLVQTLRIFSPDEWGRRARERRADLFATITAEYNYKLTSRRRINL